MGFKLTPPFPGKGASKPHAYPNGKEVEVEANNDGTIFVDKNIPDNSIDEAEVVAHEGKHMKDMDEGLLDYGDDWIEWKGKRYPRKDGKIKYNGKWVEEGYKDFPWEKRAYKAGDAAVKHLKKKYGK